jgi:hypothetical protein
MTPFAFSRGAGVEKGKVCTHDARYFPDPMNESASRDKPDPREAVVAGTSV